MGIFGILANIIFIVKKHELTRVLQFPALRESFGLPFYFFHLYFLTIYIKYNFFLFIIPSFIFSILSFLSWQFIKVVFFIEICILFGTESLGILYQYQVITIYIHLFLVVIVSYLLKYTRAGPSNFCTRSWYSCSLHHSSSVVSSEVPAIMVIPSTASVGSDSQ